MKLESIIAVWSQDSVIDSTNILHESLNIPVLHSKYYNIYCMEKIALETKLVEYKKLELSKWKFYNNMADPEEYKDYSGNFFDLKLLKSDKEKFIDMDEDILKLKTGILIQAEKVDFLKDILKMIANRTFQIKNYIDYVKFQNGS
jgi:hypothetical protein